MPEGSKHSTHKKEGLRQRLMRWLLPDADAPFPEKAQQGHNGLAGGLQENPFTRDWEKLDEMKAWVVAELAPRRQAQQVIQMGEPEFILWAKEQGRHAVELAESQMPQKIQQQDETAERYKIFYRWRQDAAKLENGDMSVLAYPFDSPDAWLEGMRGAAREYDRALTREQKITQSVHDGFKKGLVAADALATLTGEDSPLIASTPAPTQSGLRDWRRFDLAERMERERVDVRGVENAGIALVEAMREIEQSFAQGKMHEAFKSAGKTGGQESHTAPRRYLEEGDKHAFVLELLERYEVRVVQDNPANPDRFKITLPPASRNIQGKAEDVLAMFRSELEQQFHHNSAMKVSGAGGAHANRLVVSNPPGVLKVAFFERMEQQKGQGSER